MSPPLRVLTIDTALKGCVVGVYDEGEGLLHQQVKAVQRGQAEHLMPMIEEGLSEAGFSYRDIDLIAVNRGPGAFTGLRVGLSTARTLGLALDIPVVGITAFEALAATYRNAETMSAGQVVLVAIDSKRNDIFWQVFDFDGSALHDPNLGGLESFGDELGFLFSAQSCRIAIIGDCFEEGDDLHLSAIKDQKIIINESYSLSSSSQMAQLAILRAENSDQKNVSVSPLYLRQPDVSLPGTKTRQTLSEN